MAFLPRRRLVLASVHVGSAHTSWPASQMPWDAEEAALESSAQELDWSSQIACQTQENAVRAEVHWDHDLQDEHQEGCPASPMRKEDLSTAAQAFGGTSHYPQSSSHQLLQSDQRGQIGLSFTAYTEVYTFLTKSTGHVQPASLKERALYKLTDLKQVFVLLGLHLSCLP